MNNYRILTFIFREINSIWITYIQFDDLYLMFACVNATRPELLHEQIALKPTFHKYNTDNIDIHYSSYISNT